MLTAGAVKGRIKCDYTVQILDAAYQRYGVRRCWSWPSTLEGWFDLLCELDGFGPFLAYEVVTDLTHTHYLCHAPDLDTFANAGPGAVRGLNRLAGRPLDATLEPAEALREMRALLRQAGRKLPPSFPTVHLREIEHSLCEFDKYERVRLGQGAPRCTFSPNPDPLP